MLKRFFTLLLFFILSLSFLFSQYSGGFSLNDDVYKAFKLVDGNLELDEISIRQISLGNEIQVYMNAKTREYLDGVYQVTFPGASAPVGTMNISKGLLHGECLLHYRRELDKKMMFNRGVLDETVLYHNNGSPRGVITYTKGKANHAVYYYSNGQVKAKQSFNEEGRAEGQVLTYDVNGKVIAEANYHKGGYHGKKMRYNDAQYQEIESYDMGTLAGEYRLIYPDGIMNIEGHYDAKSKRTDSWTNYNKDGSINKIEHYLKGELHGSVVLYYPKEIIKLKEEYQHGKLNGKRVEYDENPHHIVSEGNYRNNKLDGEFKAYNKGELWRDCLYKDGKMIREKQLLNGKVHILRIIDDRGKLVDVRKYDEVGKTTYRNQSYKKPDSFKLVEDASGIIDIDYK